MNVRDLNDPGCSWDRISLQPLIALAVEALMVKARDEREDGRQIGDPTQGEEAIVRMPAHLGALDVGQDAGLVEDGSPNIQFSKIVRQACGAQFEHVTLREADLARDRHCVPGNAPGMPG